MMPNNPLPLPQQFNSIMINRSITPTPPTAPISNPKPKRAQKDLQTRRTNYQSVRIFISPPKAQKGPITPLNPELTITDVNVPTQPHLYYLT